MNTFRKAAVQTIAFSLLLQTGNILADTASFSPYVDKDGNISLPDDFRTNMVHLGSWFVPTGGASGFHDVYTERRSVESFRKTGAFPDGATLVKELRASHSGDFTTGKGVSYATSSVKQWFIMIKDKKGRFSDNNSWGDGWGWALIKPGAENSNVSANYQQDCLGCHTPAKSQDWVYLEGYPTLNKQR
ncbi:cytochrome P460 family protein [Motiliproteus sp. MSK22-1]|uniref:cytochrome P460 family protein n=1 Tax=Motiliproteus sp. MSK22-1 TaxID=1897630 RepID=UPI00097688E0|nr:cytochrome P460 family protein [Motiliproteus sp. MSK22-1]OMH36163.1 cytochrome C [Motiliproteus sp. MSK22-1]